MIACFCKFNDCTTDVAFLVSLLRGGLLEFDDVLILLADVVLYAPSEQALACHTRHSAAILALADGVRDVSLFILDMCCGMQELVTRRIRAVHAEPALVSIYATQFGI